MAIEHRDILDFNRHEPKGISVASVGDVYVADGTGSGSWETPVGTSANTVVVASMDDFPTAIAGIIKLLANTDYFITGNVTTADRFELSSNTLLRGIDASISGLTYTGRDTMFTGVDASSKITKIQLTCTTGTLLDISATGPGVSFQLIDVTVVACSSIGTFDGITASQFSRVTFLNIVTSGLTFVGTQQVFLAFSNRYVLTLGSVFDFGTATFDAISIDNVLATLSAGATFVNGAAGSANINMGGLGSVVNSRLSGSGTPLSGITADDARWQFALNDDIKDTRPDALLSLPGGNTTVVSVGVPTLVNGTWSELKDSQTTTTAAGRVTYDGAKTATLPFTAVLSIEPLSGTNKDLSVFFAINGSVVNDTRQLVNVASGDPKSVTVLWQADFATDDFIEIFVENESDSIDIVVNDAVFRVN